MLSARRLCYVKRFKNIRFWFTFGQFAAHCTDSVPTANSYFSPYF